jgi:hypothetical protein
MTEAGNQIRNPKFEIRNKLECPKLKIQNGLIDRRQRFGHWCFGFRICFGLRASNFGFPLELAAPERNYDGSYE